MFASLGRFVVRRPWQVIAVWILAAVALAAFSPQLGDITESDQTSFLPEKYPSVRASEVADRAFAEGEEEANATAVVSASDGSRLSKADIVEVAALAEALASADIQAVATVDTGPESVAPNGAVALVEVTFSDAEDAEDLLAPALGELREITAAELSGTGLEAGYTGTVAFSVDNQNAGGDAEAIIAIATVVLIVGLMLIIFRSPVAALMPIVTVGLVFVMSQSVIALAGEAFGLNVGQELVALLTVVLFGIGTDYILFILFRMREQLRAGDDPRTAVAVAVERVGEAIASAAGAIIIAFSAMMLASLGFFTTMGPGLSIAVAVMLAASLTLIPAVLAVLGTAVFWPSKAWRAEPDRALFARIGRLVSRRPAAVAAVTATLLLGLSSGALVLSSNYDTLSQLPEDTESAQAFQQLQEGFPAGALSPTQIYLDGAGTALDDDAVADFADALSGAPAVGQVLAPRLSSDKTVAQVPVLLADSPFAGEALNAIVPLRAAAAEAAPDGVVALVGGPTASFADLREASNRDLSVIFPVAGALIALILGLLLRSLVAPLYLLLTVVLGYAATLGAGVLVFQVIGDQPGVMFMMPIILYLFVVAIGTDYNILMIARLREEARAGRDPRSAAAIAVEHAGPSVTAAGIILAGTFASLMLAGVSFLTEMGFGVTVGILLAAFVISLLLVPALTAVLGHLAWWPGHGDEPAESAPPVTDAAAGRQLAGVVSALGGARAPASVVTVIDLAGTQIGRATVGPDGCYDLELPFGSVATYLVLAAAPGHLPDVAALAVDGVPVRHDVALVPVAPPQAQGAIGAGVATAGSFAGHSPR